MKAALCLRPRSNRYEVSEHAAMVLVVYAGIAASSRRAAARLRQGVARQQAHFLGVKMSAAMREPTIELPDQEGAAPAFFAYAVPHTGAAVFTNRTTIWIG